MSRYGEQFRRMNAIIESIRGGGYPNCSTLASELGCSYKTINRDIDHLRYEFNAPIGYDPRRAGFHFTDPTWFMQSMVASERDLLLLLVGVKALDMYGGTPLAQELQALCQQWSAYLPRKAPRAEDIHSRFTFTTLPARRIKPGIWMTAVRGLIYQRTVHFQYHSPRTDGLAGYSVHPYHIANLQGEWYLFAYVPDVDDIRQFALGRMQGARMSREGFQVRANFDPKDLLADTVGRFAMGSGKKETEVRLLLDADLYAYVTEKSWHPKQVIRQRRDGRVELSYRTANLEGVFYSVLRLGAAVKVLQPARLRRWIIDEYRKAAAHYSRPSAAAGCNRATVRPRSPRSS